MRERLQSAFGFTRGQRVRLKVECQGADHEDLEHTTPPGSAGFIDNIDRFDPPQNIAFTVVIPVDRSGERAIFNVFDEGDGPISDFIEAVS